MKIVYIPYKNESCADAPKVKRTPPPPWALAGALPVQVGEGGWGDEETQGAAVPSACSFPGLWREVPRAPSGRAGGDRAISPGAV